MPLLQVLREAFHNTPVIVDTLNIVVQTRKIYEWKKDDDIIIDEVVIDTRRNTQESFKDFLKAVRPKVNSLWTAIGMLNLSVKPEKFRNDIIKVGYNCPKMTVNFRNSPDIAEFSVGRQSVKQFSLKSLEFTVSNIKSNSSLIIAEGAENSPYDALIRGLTLIPKNIKCFIVFDEQTGDAIETIDYDKEQDLPSSDEEEESLQRLKRNNPELSFKDFLIKRERLKWLKTEKPNSFLVLKEERCSDFESKGIEVDSMLYICAVDCPECGKSHIHEGMVTRAKVSLVIVKYKMLPKDCSFCEFEKLRA